MFITIFGWVLIIFTVFWAIGDFSKDENGKAPTRNHRIKTIVIAVLVIFVGLYAAGHSSRVATAKRESISSSRAESSSKVASKKKASSKKKEKKELTSAREANEKRNFVAYKKALKSVPKNTHNAITKAYVDDSNSQTILVLSDDALTLSDNELKAVVKSAWNAGQKLLENNTPFPEDDSGASMYTTVQDSAGNELAHTSTFGSFKYDN